ncbi:MAG: hypothetical protein RIM84_16170 [Alphaproteobacteria bacterium]
MVSALAAACQSTPPAPAAPRGASSTPAPVVEDTAPVAVAPTVNAPIPQRKPPAPPTEAQLQALGAGEQRPLTPGAIIGLGAEEVRSLLGEPELRLDDPPAWIWQYQTAECTLRLTFFPEVKTQRYRTLSVALGNSDEDTEDARSRCLNAVRADRRAS